MFAFATSTIACAVRRADPPNPSDSVATAPSAAAASSVIAPPRKRSGRSRPSTTWASVKVGACPRP